MSIVGLILILALIGLLLYVVTNYLPMDPTIKAIILVVVLVAVILWLAQLFGVLGPLDGALRLR